MCRTSKPPAAMRFASEQGRKEEEKNHSKDATLLNARREKSARQPAATHILSAGVSSGDPHGGLPRVDMSILDTKHLSSRTLQYLAVGREFNLGETDLFLAIRIRFAVVDWLQFAISVPERSVWAFRLDDGAWAGLGRSRVDG